MQIIARCPGCGRTQLLEGNAADRRIKCRKCGRLFKVPKLKDLPKATNVIKRAKSTLYVDENGKSFG